MSNWYNVCKIFNVIPLAIVNYESIKKGKYYDKFGNKVDCKFIKIIETNEKKILYKWFLPRYSIVILDEVHKCKNQKSQNSKLLLSLKDQWNAKILMLSATLSDKPESFHVFGYMLGFYKSLRQGNNWIKGMLLEDKGYIGSQIKLSEINKQIYPQKGSRMRISELGDKFPLNQISADGYFIKEEKRNIVNKAFSFINENSSILKSALDNNQNGLILGEITKARQLIETIKIDIIIELVKDFIENDYSVVIFVNYNNTINELAKIFKTNCILNGELSINKRNENIEKFQNNEVNLIICNINIGSLGISLHDLYGKPRASIISPSFSSEQLIQSLGRISRVGSLSPAIQRIIYCAGTCEEIICNKLKEKLKFLSKLNDNDLIDFN